MDTCCRLGLLATGVLALAVLVLAVALQHARSGAEGARPLPRRSGGRYRRWR